MSEITENADASNPEKITQECDMQETLSRIKQKYLVMSGKGGVGKSTVAVNLAVCLSIRGQKVGLMDIDLHGPDTLKMIGLDSIPMLTEDKKLVPLQYNGGLKVISIASMLQSPDTPVIWRGPMKFGAIKQFISDVSWGELDYLIIDSPPGPGDEPLTVAQQIPGSKSIIVTTPQAVSILDVRKSINFCRELSMPVLGLIENMSGMNCPYCGETIELFGTGGGRETAENMGITFLGSVPVDPEISRSGDAGTPFVLSQPNSNAARSIHQFVQHIIDQSGSCRGTECQT